MMRFGSFISEAQKVQRLLLANELCRSPEVSIWICSFLSRPPSTWEISVDRSRAGTEAEAFSF